MKEKGRGKPWEEYVAGFGSGVCNVGVTFPIYKLIFRQMLHGVNSFDAIKQLHKEGIRLLYRGLLPPLCQKAVSSSIMFGGYNTYGQLLISYYPSINNQLAKSMGAGLAGVNEAILAPFERIQTLLQDKHYNSKLNNSYHAVSTIWKSHGVFEFYRGFSMIVLRNSAANILFFAAKEKLETVIPETNNTGSKLFKDFMIGSVIGAALSTMYYPLNVIKTRMQCQLGGPFESPRAVLNLILVERGGKFRKMFRGVHLNYTRSLISWGITNASYELILKWLYQMKGSKQS